MQDLSDTLNKKSSNLSLKYISTDIKLNTKSTDTSNSKPYDNDYLYEQLPDLVNPDFRPWYMRMFYQLGRDRVLRLAAIARSDGKDSRRYFSRLLKSEVLA